MKNPFESHPRIFVVDDEPDIAQMLAVILQMNLFDATPFSDPLVALEASGKLAPEYVISDIVMPGMSGVELAIALRKEAPNCKVLLFTGHAGATELLKDAIAAGHDFRFVEKPIHPKALVEVIRSL